MLIMGFPYVVPFGQWEYLRNLSGNNLEDFYKKHLSKGILELVDEIERINPEISRTGIFVCEIELNLVKNVFWHLKIYWIEPLPDGHSFWQICELCDTEIYDLNCEEIIALFKGKFKQGLEKIIGSLEGDIIDKKEKQLNFRFALRSLT